MTNTPAREGLPELPEPVIIDRHIPTNVVIRGYTAEQMHAYALAAIAGREAQGGGDTSHCESQVDFERENAQIRVDDVMFGFRMATSGVSKQDVETIARRSFRAAALPHPQPECCVPDAGEPSFVLLGRDPQAPALVEQWAGEREHYEPLSTKPAKARAIAERMRQFKAANPGKGMATPPPPSDAAQGVQAVHAEAGAVAGYVFPDDLAAMKDGLMRTDLWAKPPAQGGIAVFLHPAQPASQQGEVRVFQCRRCPVSVESRWLEPECPECGDPCESDPSGKPAQIPRPTGDKVRAEVAGLRQAIADWGDNMRNETMFDLLDCADRIAAALAQEKNDGR